MGFGHRYFGGVAVIGSFPQAVPIKVYTMASKPKGSVFQWEWRFVHETGSLIDAFVRAEATVRGTDR